MGARLQIKPHLRAEAVEARYRAARSALERTHWQVIRLFLAGEHSEEIARIVGYSVVWVRVLAERYNAHGPEALLDGRGVAPMVQLRVGDQHAWSGPRRRRVLLGARRPRRAWRQRPGSVRLGRSSDMRSSSAVPKSIVLPAHFGPSERDQPLLRLRSLATARH